MNEEVIAEKTRKSPPRGAGGAKKMRRYTAAEKLHAVRLHREEGFSMPLVCRELGIGKSTLVLWLQAYRLGGAAGLEPVQGKRREPRLPAPITDKIIELKQQNPPSASSGSARCCVGVSFYRPAPRRCGSGCTRPS